MSLIFKSLKLMSMFFLGVFVTLLLTSIMQPGTAVTDDLQDGIILQVPLNGDRDKPSPQNYFTEDMIKVYKDRVVLDAENIKWAAFEDTKSMLPFINKDSNALQIEPVCPGQISEGDIISYKSEYAEGIIIHRVVFIGEDEEGTYFILKGDNNPASDPGKIRCSQILRKLVAVIY